MILTQFYSLLSFCLFSDLFSFSCQSLALHYLPARFWSCDGRAAFWSHFQVRGTSQNFVLSSYIIHAAAQCTLCKTLSGQIHSGYDSSTQALISRGLMKASWALGVLTVLVMEGELFNLEKQSLCFLNEGKMCSDVENQIWISEQYVCEIVWKRTLKSPWKAASNEWREDQEDQSLQYLS